MLQNLNSAFYIELTRKLVQVFPQDVTESPKWNFWPIQYICLFFSPVCATLGFLGGSDCKESACQFQSLCGYPLQYSHLENSMDRRAWKATVHDVAESDTTEWLTLTFSLCVYHTTKWGEKDTFNTASMLYLRPPFSPSPLACRGFLSVNFLIMIFFFNLLIIPHEI